MFLKIKFERASEFIWQDFCASYHSNSDPRDRDKSMLLSQSEQQVVICRAMRTRDIIFHAIFSLLAIHYGHCQGKLFKIRLLGLTMIDKLSAFLVTVTLP
jgi:hypothetical protein